MTTKTEQHTPITDLVRSRGDGYLEAVEILEEQRAALLEALKALLDQADEAYPHFESPRGTANRDKARAAIAAAEGR